ncbi:MAG: phasin family protein [Candidatus Hydrogenedentota bacterium]|nr:MAG: phasin family protein [Candidatus Hydrogenedentota bacterium]
MAAKKSKKAAKKATRKAKTKADKWTWTDILRTPILASIGAFSIAEEGIEKFVRDLVERGEASEKEGKKIVDDFRKRTRRNRKDLERNVDERIQKALRSFRLPTKKDVDALSKKIDELEKRVNKLTRKSR